LAAGLKHGIPQEDLRDDRQEPHERAQREIAAIDQPLCQRDAEDGPPSLNASGKRTHSPKFGFARSMPSGVLPSISRMTLLSPTRKAPLSLSICGLGSHCSTPILYLPGGTSTILKLPSLSHRACRVVYSSLPTSGIRVTWT